MRAYLIGIWLLLPIAGAAYHFGPGQRALVLDDVTALLARADDAARNEIWDEAFERYNEALAKLPPEETATARRIRLERAKVQMMMGQLPQAHDELEQLVEELAQGEPVDARLLADARETLGNARFYLTWLMRLEGVPRDVWEPEIEAARELYRFLAEAAAREGDTDAARRHQESLEAAIRLARMELKELQGLPLPNQ